MKKLNFTILFAALLSLSVTRAFAYDAEINGIYYDFNSTTKTATVTFGGSYSGYVKIPSEVNYDNAVYSVTAIGNRAFENCSELTVITIPNSVTSIDFHAFHDCSGLTNVTIPNSVKIIDIGAFAGCKGLTSLTIPNSVKSIGFYAFSNCNSLTNLTIPNSVTYIGGSAFSGCNSLTNLIIPNSITYISGSAFSGCNSLTNLIIPNSITYIGDGAFAGCYSLTSVTIPNSVTIIGGGAFRNCSGLTSITIGNSVTSIGDNAFFGCSGLTSVTIPNSVTSIGEKAFQKCSSLTFATISKNIKNFPKGLFADCTSLKDVYCYIEEVPTTAADAFNNANQKNATLHVPDAAVSDYKSIAPWSNFGTIVGINGGGGESLKCAKPRIYYSNGKLSFESDTEGVVFQSSITDSDIRQYSSNEIQLGVTYNISVYTKKSGYEDSEMATATLCWIDVEPKTEGITDGTTGAKQIEANAVLIQSENGVITVSGANDGTTISILETNGIKVGSVISHNGQAVVNTKLPFGSIAIVKIGEKIVKMMVK